VLQDQRFERVGGSQTIQTDVRLIAATNRDLRETISEGEFRSDLYYRLSVFTIHLPPLRERGDDLSLLVQYFLRRFAAELGKDVKQVGPEAMEILRAYSWPGNVRELQSVTKQALLQATGPVLLPDFLPATVKSGATPGEPARDLVAPALDDYIQHQLQAGASDLYANVLRAVRQRLLTNALRHTDGNQVQAARLLGLSRSSLRNELRTLGITVERSVSTDDERPSGD
jgi:two-component system nitrogen regulation response regulator GlnG